MADDVQDILDEVGDPAGEGLHTADELDLAQDREDREAAASPKETAEAEEDLTEEKFVYTLPGGEEIEGTMAEIVEAVAAKEVEAKVAEKLAETKPEEPAKTAAEKPGEVADEAAQIEPVQWDKVGPEFQEIVEEGKWEGLGPQLQGLINREIVTSPFIAGIMAQFVDRILSDREQGVKEKGSLKEFVGDEPSADEVKAFQAANPWAKTREIALVGLKSARLEKEIADLKAGKATTVKEAKAEGAKETIKNLKAKGTLRRIGGTGGKSAAKVKGEFDLTDPNQRIASAVKRIERMRGGGT